MTTLAQAGKDTEYLTAEREATLVAKAQAGDKRARDALVMSHVRLVVALASKHKAHHDFDDLVSAGMIGLVAAVDKFKTDKGARFGSYCQWHVKAEMFKLMQKESNLVSFGDSAGKKRGFFGLAKAKRRLGISGEPTDAEISALAADLRVTEDDVRATLERKRAVRSLNVHVVNKEGTEAQATLLDFLEDTSLVAADDAMIESEERRATADTVADALDTLTDRERLVVTRRKLGEDGKTTFELLSQELGVSRERVRQIEEAAMKKITRHLQGTSKPKVSRAKPCRSAKRRERMAYIMANPHLSPKELATALGVSVKTIQNHLRAVRRERERLSLAA